MKKYYNVKQFITTNDVPFEPNERSLYYRNAIDKINKHNRQLICVLYFMKTALGIDSVTTMFLSTQKTRDLMKCLRFSLLIKAVTKEWEQLFDNFINDSINRINHVQKIMKEDLYLTEWYPYFQDKGFDKLFDIKTEAPGGKENNELFEKMKLDFEEYKKEHPDKIADHMAKAYPLINALETQRLREREKERLERQRLSEARREEKEEIRQSKILNSEIDKRERKINREFERYWK